VNKARVHHAARWRGGVAAGGARAAARADAAHRRARARSGGRSGISGPVGAFLQGLAVFWSIGRNVRVDARWAITDAAEIRRHAAELVALAPDVILAHGTTTLGPLRQVSRTVPTVFTSVADPVGAGFVESMARPGGNATGFIAFEWNISGKWLELLKEIAPGVYELTINLRTAKALGLDVPPSLLDRADELIE
jgi:putative tryptophan/tyrosine transport system substrate-binding protein